MSTLLELESAVRELPPERLAEFRGWFYQFDAEAWDKQFEKDVLAGHLDGLAEEALDDLKNGHCRDL